ncbi:hypothetical protein BLOT_013548 [Blomia tropicalis]|nr:hypothetical protein BLOT_013548 [Blomia tropicalis]
MTLLATTRCSCLRLVIGPLRVTGKFNNVRTMSTESAVQFETKGNKGIITLNRPKALNALNLDMVRLIYPQLKKWESDSKMKMVILKGAGEKAFCAGGDVRAIAESGRGSPISQDFFREEYRLNGKIGTLGIPFVSLIHGICMGGGVGLSVHGTFRVVTENAIFAMPETQIGFFSDVGGSYFLPRLPGKLGTYLALTGRRLKGLDIVKAGIATHFVSSSHLNYLEDELLRIEEPNANRISHILAKHQEQWKDDFKQEFSEKKHMGRINSTFGVDSVEKIIEALNQDSSSWSKEVFNDLSKASPLSLKVTFELIKRGQKQILPECLKMEFRVSQNILKHDDFYSGVTARLIDKTNNPKWNPQSLSDVTDSMVDSIFQKVDGVSDLNL